MNLKKLLALALALVMVFALAACGGEPAPAESGSGEPATTIKVAALESAYEETYPGMWQEVCDAFLEQAWIPAGAANIDAAKQFIAFLYSDTAADIFAKGGAVQPIRGMTDQLEGDNKLFYSIYDSGAGAAMGSFAAYSPIPGIDNTSVFFEPINSLVGGTLTIDQWKANIISATDQMRANLLA